MEKKEKKALGVISIILSVFALIFSAIPFANFASYILGAIGVLLGAVSIYLNRSKNKYLSIVGINLSILSLIVGVTTRILYVNKFESDISTYANLINRTDDQESNFQEKRSEEKKLAKQIDETLSTTKFEKQPSKYKYIDDNTYSSTIKNVTSTDIKNFHCYIYLMDSDGKRIGKESISAQDWKSGEAIEFEFSTDKEFSSLKVGSASITQEDFS